MILLRFYAPHSDWFKQKTQTLILSSKLRILVIVINVEIARSTGLAILRIKLRLEIYTGKQSRKNCWMKNGNRVHHKSGVVLGDALKVADIFVCKEHVD